MIGEAPEWPLLDTGIASVHAKGAKPLSGRIAAVPGCTRGMRLRVEDFRCPLYKPGSTGTPRSYIRWCRAAAPAAASSELQG